MFEIQFKLRDRYGSWCFEPANVNVVPKVGDYISFDNTSYKVSFITHELQDYCVQVVVFAEQI